MAVQKAQRLAALGTRLKHSGQARSVGSSGVLRRSARACNLLIGWIIRKNITAAIITKVIIALTKSPYINLLPLKVK